LLEWAGSQPPGANSGGPQRVAVEHRFHVAIGSFTVNNHVQRIMKKLDAANRTEAVAKYRQEGLRARRKLADGNAVPLRSQSVWAMARPAWHPDRQLTHDKSSHFCRATHL